MENPEFFTPQERLEIYEAALASLKAKRLYYSGICYEITCFMLNQSQNSVFKAKWWKMDGSEVYYFPELVVQKPSVTCGPFWWPKGERAIRMDVLQKAIEMVKQQIEKTA